MYTFYFSAQAQVTASCFHFRLHAVGCAPDHARANHVQGSLMSTLQIEEEWFLSDMVVSSLNVPEHMACMLPPPSFLGIADCETAPSIFLTTSCK